MAVTEISQQAAEAPTTSDDNIEKQPSTDNISREFSDDGKLDDGAERKQEGVRQVEAITTVWSKQMLAVMFLLYVFIRAHF
jgi:hypothetical protein